MSNRDPKTKIKDYVTKYYKHGIIIGYVLLVLFFFIAEIGAQLNWIFLAHVRATDQVLILLGLLFLPFLLSVLVALIERLKLKVGGVEVDAEFVRLKRKVKEFETGQSELGGRVEDTQQVFLSILRGKNLSRKKRLQIPELVIGCKDFNEQKILSQVLTQHIKLNLGIDCRCLIPNGGTIKNYFDLVNGWIDGYIEYTGTGCMLLGIDTPGGDRNLGVDNLNKRSEELAHSVEWLKPLGFTNNYVIVVKKDHIKNVESIKDLEHQAGKLTFGGNLEFMNRSDGYPGLCKTYNLRFQKELICSYHDRYRLLLEEKVDVIEGFETDPQLRNRHELTVLDDPKPFFPKYYALPVFRKDALDEVKNLRETVNQLAKYGLDIKMMREYIADFAAKAVPDMEEAAAEKQAKEIIEAFGRKANAENENRDKIRS